MPLTRKTLVERFEGGAAGQSITTANSIFTLTSADEDPPYGPRFFVGGRTGNLASNVPYPPAQGGTGLLRWDPPLADTSVWTLVTWYGFLSDQDPVSFPTYAAFLELLLSIAGTEAAGLEFLRANIPVSAALVGYEMWFRISGDRSVTAEASLVSTEIYLTAISSLIRQPDGVSFGLRLSGAPSDPIVSIGSWYRIAFVTPGRPDAGSKAYDSAGTLLSTSTTGFASAFDVLTRGVEIGLASPITYRPIEIDDVTITYEVWSPTIRLPIRRTEHPTRRYPREDGAGLSGARRNYPPPRAGRVFGGQN